MADDPNFLYRIATLYYKREMTQEEIAGKMGISRPMVSRALARALALGIVKIEVIPPQGVSELSQRLSHMLGLVEVIVAPAVNGNGSDAEDRTEDVAECGARYLEKVIETETNIGIGWGKTVYSTIMNLGRHTKQSGLKRIVPLLGSMGRNESHFQVNAIVNTVANRMGGLAYYYNVSTLLAGGAAELEEVKARYKDVFELWHNLDVAVIGLGVLGPKPSFPIGEYPSEELEHLSKKNAIGDVLGRFFSKDGFLSLLQEGVEATYIGIPFEDLLRIKKRICLASGTNKVEGIITASRLGIFNTLVTDSRTAAEIAQRLEERE